MTVPIRELIELLDLVDSGYGETEAFVDRETGRIFVRSEFDDGDQELPEDVYENPRYVPAPSKHDLDLGRQLVFDYASRHLDRDDEERVHGFFRHRGAYGRFKDFLERRGALQAWYDFEAKARERAVRDWCLAEDLEIDDGPAG